MNEPVSTFKKRRKDFIIELRTGKKPEEIEAEAAARKREVTPFGQGSPIASGRPPRSYALYEPTPQKQMIRKRIRISQNIRFTLEKPDGWIIVTPLEHEVEIEKGKTGKTYNMPDMPGWVYDPFDCSAHKVENNTFIITGVGGERRVVGAAALEDYNVFPELITETPMTVKAKADGVLYAAICIYRGMQFTLEDDFGAGSVHYGNRPNVFHGDGDYILVRARWNGSEYVPDFTDSGRIVNGSVFEYMFKKI